jgi:hypothetical protein
VVPVVVASGVVDFGACEAAEAFFFGAILEGALK